jgi:hypothetical protein
MIPKNIFFKKYFFFEFLILLVATLIGPVLVATATVKPTVKTSSLG